MAHQKLSLILFVLYFVLFSCCLEYNWITRCMAASLKKPISSTGEIKPSSLLSISNNLHHPYSSEAELAAQLDPSLRYQQGKEEIATKQFQRILLAYLNWNRNNLANESTGGATKKNPYDKEGLRF